MIRLILIAALLSGCAASFQPWPGVTQSEFKAAMASLAQNDQLLANKIVELSPKPKEDKKK